MILIDLTCIKDKVVLMEMKDTDRAYASHLLNTKETE